MEQVIAVADERIQRVIMPKWGLSMEAGKVTDWLVAVGDEIDEGTEICEIDTDKIAGELESTWTGAVRALVVDVNESVPVGGTIAVVATSNRTCSSCSPIRGWSTGSSSTTCSSTSASMGSIRRCAPW
jgi:pyruvate/2-oxoglutarate dehydrogenase complex dihydrolipoamide acyltransferase (E2) component